MNPLLTPEPQVTNAQDNRPGKVRLTVDVSSELNQTLNELAEDAQVSKSDILRRAITLMELAVQARKRGQKMALIDKDQPAQTEIVGV